MFPLGRSALTLATKKRGGGSVSSGVVDFDGTGDYFSRGSDLTGDSNGKTFTLSVLFNTSAISSTQIVYDTTNIDFRLVYLGSSNTFTVVANNLSGTQILDVDISVSLSSSTWYHLLVSVDLNSTSKRHTYLDDADKSTSTTWNTYTNDNINFTVTDHVIAATTSGGSSVSGKLAHFFFDYTYRDLSVESNRRLFLNSNGEPATGQADLNPILYMPMNNSSDLDENLGTGGSFTVNGDPQFVDELPSVTV